MVDPVDHPAESGMEDQKPVHSRDEERSLGLVQGVFVSIIIAGIAAMAALVSAFYPLAVGRENLPASSTLGLWVMSGVIGLVGAGGVLLANRRSLLSPWLLLGLLPMVVSWYFVRPFG